MQYLSICLFAMISLVSSATTLVQFSNGTWIENLAVRSNGGILLTELNPQPVLLYVEPSNTPLSAQTIYTFPSPATGLSGIVEIGNDIFYLVSQTIEVATSQLTPGSGNVWRVNMTAYPDVSAAVTFVANLTDVVFPNGATALPDSQIILIADSAAGKVFSVDVDTGVVQTAVDTATLQPPNGTTIGVNGVHAPGDGFLYFTNSGANSFGRIPIDNATGSCIGDAQILFQNPAVSPDDFTLLALSQDGLAAYIADKLGNRVVLVNGTSNDFETVTDIAGPTSVVVTGWGGLYISSTGGDDDYDINPIPVGGALSTS